MSEAVRRQWVNWHFLPNIWKPPVCSSDGSRVARWFTRIDNIHVPSTSTSPGALDGQCRYAHVGSLRGDGVAPGILGMEKVIGDDSLRRALSAIAPAPDAKHNELQRGAQQGQVARSTQWMQDQLRHSIAQATEEP